MYKSHLLLKFYVLRKRSSDIPSLVEHLFKIYDVMILDILLWFGTTRPKCTCKATFSWNFRRSAKEAFILLFLVVQHVYSNFNMYSVLTLIFFNFDFPVFCMYKTFIVEMLRASQKKRWYYFFRGAIWKCMVLFLI